MRTIIAILLVAGTLGAAGCTSAVSGIGHGPSPLPDPPAGQVVFQVEPEIGGLAPQTLLRAARPVLTVYGDGTAFASDVPRGYAAPWSFRRGTIPRATLTKLIADAHGSHLFDGADFGEPAISDVGSTTVRFHPGGGRASSVSPYAFGEDEIDDQLTSIQRANRVALRELISRFSAAVGPLSAWTPTRVEIVSPPHAQVDPSEETAPWPGPEPATILTHTSWRGRCGELSGTVATRVFAAARQLGTQFWTVHGVRQILLVRAMLPGEASCPQ